MEVIYRLRFVCSEELALNSGQVKVKTDLMDTLKNDYLYGFMQAQKSQKSMIIPTT